MTTLALNLRPILELTDEQFYQLCQANRDLRLERTAKGELIIMPPTGSETGGRNASLTAQIWLWNQQTRLGKSFDSSTGFKLPNGANRSPDAAWVRRERWDALTPEQKRGFAPLCPDFVVELCSPSDDLEDVQQKMQEYLANGIRLGWLIDPKTRRVEIYRPDGEVEILDNPATLSGETVLPGFVLDLQPVFED
ncbi:MAG: Uma2 family endonuclease [Coleofasciculaceae cyanobacterium]